MKIEIEVNDEVAKAFRTACDNIATTPLTDEQFKLALASDVAFTYDHFVNELTGSPPKYKRYPEWDQEILIEVLHELRIPVHLEKD